MLALNRDRVRNYYRRLVKVKSSDYFERYDPNLLESRPQVKRLVCQLLTQLFPKRVDSMLDLGCGTGFYFPLLSQKCRTLTGLDLSRTMLHELQQLITQNEIDNCRLLQGTAQQLPFAEASFDQIFSLDFIHHSGELSQVFSEVYRVLKPGGRYVAVEPNILNPSILYYHLRRPSEWGLLRNNQWTIRSELEQFRKVSVRYDNTVISFLNEGSQWLWKVAEVLTRFPPTHLLRFRYILEIER